MRPRADIERDLSNARGLLLATESNLRREERRVQLRQGEVENLRHQVGRLESELAPAKDRPPSDPEKLARLGNLRIALEQAEMARSLQGGGGGRKERVWQIQDAIDSLERDLGIREPEQA